MKDIKSLYLEAKSRGRQEDINAYMSNIRYLLENKPHDYLSNIEYIILSSTGLSTFHEFVENYGIPMVSYEPIMITLENAIRKCRQKSINDKPYRDTIVMMESFRDKYQHCFMMFENYHTSDLGDYLEDHFGTRDFKKSLDRYGPDIIPDMLISTKNENQMAEFLNAVTESIQFSPYLCEWIIEAFKDIEYHSPEMIAVMEKVQENSLTQKTENLKIRKTALMRESVLLGDDNIMIEYSMDEIKAMEDLISFKEYMITCLENPEEILDTQKEIYSLYEELSGFIDEDIATSVVPMLPGGNIQTIKEDWLSNTMNKKTGQIPGYLGKNHNLGYGEDDQKDTKPDEGHTSSIDDFKRPSSIAINKAEPKEIEEPVVDIKAEPPENGKINNYYYYNYINSNNTSNSHNSDRSVNYNSDRDIESDRHIEEFMDLAQIDLEYKTLMETVDSILQEAGEFAMDFPIQAKGPSRLSVFFEKVKQTIRKILDFIINIYGKIFPKNIVNFHFLEKRFEKSEGIKRMLADNKRMIKIMEVQVPSVNDTTRAINDVINFINNGMKKEALPKRKIEDYQSSGITKIAIYYGSIHENDNVLMGFNIASSAKLSNVNKFDIEYDFAREKISTYLSEDNLLKAFGVKIPMAGPGFNFNLGISEIKNLAVNLRTILFIKKTFSDDKESYDTLLAILRCMTDFTKMVHQTMNRAYSSAVNILKDANDPTNGPASVSESIESPIWELDVLGDSYIDEGIKDILGKVGEVAKKGFNKIKTFMTMRKTISNLQKMDFIMSRPRKMPLPFLGTNIPIKSKLITEDFDFNDIITDFSPILEKKGIGLTEDQITKFISRYMNAYKVLVLFTDIDTALGELVAQRGGCAVISVPPDKIKNLDSILDELPGGLPRRDFIQILVVNMEILNSIGFNDINELELIMLHEYGHILTMSDISDSEWIEYTQKVNMMQALLFAMNGSPTRNDVATLNMCYYQLKPEYISNKKMSVNPEKLTKIMTKGSPDPKWQNSIYYKMIPTKLPTRMISLLGAMINGKKPTEDELDYLVIENTKIYQHILPPDKFEILKPELEGMKEAYLSEAVGDVDNDKPTTDAQDFLLDVDRTLNKGQQAVKRGVQKTQNVGRALVKPVKRTSQWVSNMVTQWKDMDENRIKEKLADPHARGNLFKAVKTAIVGGSLFKAGLLLNPFFIFFSLTRGIGKNKREFRIRNEMIGELKTELGVIDEKIRDADRNGDNKEKYQLMRFKNEINKKLVRVGGSKGMRKVI